MSGIPRVKLQGEWKTRTRCAIFGSCSMTSEHETKSDLYRMSQDSVLPNLFGSIGFRGFHVSHSMVDVGHSTMKQLMVTHCSIFLRCETVPDTSHVSN